MLNNPVEKSNTFNKRIELKSFLKYADITYLCIGIVAYDVDEQPQTLWLRLLLQFVCIYQFVNMNLVMLIESLYVVFAIIEGTRFLEVTMDLNYIAFTFMGMVKIWLVMQQRSLLNEMIKEFEDLHPAAWEQPAFGTANYLRAYSRISTFYIVIHQLLIWTYNLYWFFYYLIYDVILNVVEFEQELPYYCWVPWSYRNHWSYYLLYVSQNMAGLTCMFGQISADLMMCALITLLVMHFTQLGTRIEQHVAGMLSPTQDLQFLHQCIVYHERLIQLCDGINEVFGVCLLFNFISSSFVICFLGFLLVTNNAQSLYMILLFLLCAMVQIFMISRYAQRLQEASEGIGYAVYNHDWFNADIRYRKGLILITQRAQKPCRVKATSFLPVSLLSMTDLLQLSYKYFALMRTMYAK